ncbi:MAG: TIGR03643 family protein [Alphaproteobacteria bacterium]|nr:TIGR03643 family protein [Alphaproteobacteria bacterium]
MTSKRVLSPDISHVIELAWDDQTSFEAILADTGLSQPQVIEIMRRHLKPSSFRMWRARVCGRQTKHAARRGTRFRNVSED